MTPIITSFLDQDLYKITMGQVVWKKFPDTVVEYAYKCRNDIDLDELAPAIRKQLDAVAELPLLQEEVEFLEGVRYFQPEFVRTLKRMRPNPDNVIIETNPFRIRIKQGLWAEDIYWEIFILAIVSQLHYQRMEKAGKIPKDALERADAKLTEKIEMIRRFMDKEQMPFRLIEFGTRRRYSASWQEHVLERLITEIPEAIFGTSNVHLACKYKLRPVGTMAHEYLQAFQAFGRVRESQKAALQAWADVYRGDLGIALTDVISMDAFLRDFDLYFAKLFDGQRHDSGCPRIWANKAIGHYQKLAIEPKSKALVFSDGLNIPKALDLCREFEPQIKTSYGLGTDLTCDIPDIAPVNHVLKMVMCNGQPVAKLSDSPGKSMCENEPYLGYLKDTFNYPH